MANIVISERMEESSVNLLETEFDVTYDPDLHGKPNALADAARNASAVIVRNQTQMDRDLISQLGDLRVIGRLGVGLDNIDLDACREAGIEVIPATGANTIAVAEYVIGALLTLTRQSFAATGMVIEGAWPRSSLIGGELHGKTLGLVGYGAIARAVATRARALGMSTVGYDPFIDSGDPAWGETRKLDLSDLLSSVDAISIHVPLTPDTRNLLDAEAIARMKPSAMVVNTSRGGIIDEPALIQALEAGAIGGAALDVFASEPVDRTAGALFSQAPNLILTPHIAGITQESDVRTGHMIARAVAERIRKT